MPILQTEDKVPKGALFFFAKKEEIWYNRDKEERLGNDNERKEKQFSNTNVLHR